MTNDAVNAFLQQQGAKAFPFENVGDTVSGRIVSTDLRQQTHMETGEPLVWRDGSPRMLLVVQLQTELQDDESDDGIRSIWARGGNFDVASGSGTSSLTAIKDAMRKAEAKTLDVGGTLAMRHSGLGVAKKGFSPPKLYVAQYAPATKSVDVEDLF